MGPSVRKPVRRACAHVLPGMKRFAGTLGVVGGSGGSVGVLAVSSRMSPGFAVLLFTVLGLLGLLYVREHGRQRRAHNVDVLLAAAEIYQVGGDGAAALRALGLKPVDSSTSSADAEGRCPTATACAARRAAATARAKKRASSRSV